MSGLHCGKFRQTIEATPRFGPFAQRQVHRAMLESSPPQRCRASLGFHGAFRHPR